eukprot:COSAG01_NODE_10335_length_2191_cov_1.579828_2_plen_238_part_00
MASAAAGAPPSDSRRGAGSHMPAAGQPAPARSQAASQAGSHPADDVSDGCGQRGRNGDTTPQATVRGDAGAMSSPAANRAALKRRGTARQLRKKVSGWLLGSPLDEDDADVAGGSSQRRVEQGAGALTEWEKVDMKGLFSAFDVSNDGIITHEEFGNMLQNGTGIVLDNGEVAELFDEMDADGSGAHPLHTGTGHGHESIYLTHSAWIWHPRRNWVQGVQPHHGHTAEDQAAQKGGE